MKHPGDAHGMDGASANAAFEHIGLFTVHRLDEPAVAVPDASLLFSGTYHQSGQDLIISKPFETVTIRDYFRDEVKPALVAPDGSSLSAAVILALTEGRHGSQYAGDEPVRATAIGRVETVTGSATVIRNGQSIALHAGDLVFKGDAVATGEQGSLAITFIDGTTFTLAESARMVLNDMVYQPGGSNNSSLLSLVQGSITFVAGEVAHTGEMKVDTPVATMGIRGTAVHVNISAHNGPARFSVMREPDGRVGSYILYDHNDGSQLATVSDAGTVIELQLSNGQIVINAMPKSALDLQQEQLLTQQVFAAYQASQQDPLLRALLQTHDPSSAGSHGSSGPPQTGPSGGQPEQPSGNTTPPAPNPAAPQPLQSTPPPSHGNDDDTSPQPLPIAAPVPALTAPAETIILAKNGVVDASLQIPAETLIGIQASNGSFTSVSAQGTAIQGVYGDLTIYPDGSLHYAADHASALGAGALGFDVFTYTVENSAGATATGTLTFDIAGASNNPSDHYAWTGPVSGNWQDAANWDDTTLDLNPASVPPGSGNDVTIGAAADGAVQEITGTGAAAALTLDGPTLFAGQFTADSVTANAGLQLDASGTLSVSGNVSFGISHNFPEFGPGFDIFGLDGSFFAGAGVPIITSDDYVINGGTLTAGTLTTNGSIIFVNGGGSLRVNGNISDTTDASSYFIDDSTFVAGGTFTSSDDEIFAANGSQVQLAGLATTAADGFGSYLLADSTSSIEIGTAGGAAVGSITIDPWVVAAAGGVFAAQNIINNGTIAVTDDNELLLDGNLSGNGHIDIGNDAELSFPATDASWSGNTIAFTGNGGLLALENLGYASSAFAPVISGLNTSNAIEISGLSSGTVSAAYDSASHSLTILNGTTQIAQFTLSGDYTGDTFYATNIFDFGITQIGVRGSGDVITAPAGTSSQDRYIWTTGALEGSWDAASNWDDTTAGTDPAGVAPGANDDVTIGSPYIQALSEIITGTGRSASLTITGPTILAGEFQTGTLTVDDTGYYNSLSIQNDGTSSLEVGNLGNAAAGTLTIDAGATATLAGDISAQSIVDNGTIAVAANNSVTLDNVTLTGTGNIALGTGSLLDISGIDLDSSLSLDPSITGLNGSNAIEFAGSQVTAASYNCYSHALTLFDGTTPVANLQLNGNYAGASFYAEATFPDETQIGVLNNGDTNRAPSGTQSTDNYEWSGPLAGSWDAAANWNDTSADLNPANTAPGSNDDVTIGATDLAAYRVITGPGNSASLTIGGPTILAGQFTTGALTVDATEIDINDGAALHVTGDVTDATALAGGDIGYSDYQITGGDFTVDGTFFAADDEISAEDGSSVQLAQLAPAPTYGVDDLYLFADGTSSLEIGTAGGAAAGSITIDSGMVVTLTGLLFAPALIDAGTLIVAADNGLELTGNSISGTGGIEISDGATLAFDNAVTSSTTISFLGADGTLYLETPSAFHGHIAGIAGTGDILDLSGFNAATTSATTGTGSFNSNTDTTALTVTDSSDHLSAVLSLTGNYADSSWTVTDNHNGGVAIADPPAAAQSVIEPAVTSLTADADVGSLGDIVTLTGQTTGADAAGSVTWDQGSAAAALNEVNNTFSASEDLTPGDHIATLTLDDAATSTKSVQAIDIDISQPDAPFMFAPATGPAVLVGSASANVSQTLTGSVAYQDTIIAGAGNDTLTGMGGGDTFVFKPNMGNDQITDLQTTGLNGSHDTIDLSAFHFANYQALLAAAATDASGDTTIALGTHTLTLDHVQKADLQSDLFHL